MAVMTFFDGRWIDGSPPVMRSMSQSFMHGTTVFDGARAFGRAAPDLDLHCLRLIRSAEVMGLDPPVTAERVTEIAVEGIRKFPGDAELYVRPSLFADDGFLLPDPASTKFVMTVFDVPLPEPTGLKACLSSYRRPSPDMAPTLAKASCLYPTSGHAIREANAKGYDNAIMRDIDDNVVELASANIWLAKDGIAYTPEPNDTFLNGVTKKRVMALFAEAGIEVRETPLRIEDFHDADEVFSTGNYGKVLPLIRVDDRDFQPGPIYARAREFYWDYAAGQRV